MDTLVVWRSRRRTHPATTPLTDTHPLVISLYSITDTGPEHGYSPFAGFLQQESYSNPAWLTSISLLSVLKLDIYREYPNPDLLKYKAEALQSLNNKIKDPNVDMPTVLAIAALFCFEVCFGHVLVAKNRH